MRTRCLVFLLQCAPLVAWAQDTLSTSNTLRSHQINWEVSFEIGGDILSVFTSPNWQPVYSLRAGVGKIAAPEEEFSFRGHVEYHRYAVGQGAPDFITHLSTRSAKRHDIAAYAGLIFYHHIALELGAVYVKSDPVDVLRNDQLVGPWKYGGVSRFNLHLAAGGTTDVTLGENIALRIGGYYLFPTSGAGRVLLIRMGLTTRY